MIYHQDFVLFGIWQIWSLNSDTCIGSLLWHAGEVPWGAYKAFTRSYGIHAKDWNATEHADKCSRSGFQFWYFHFSLLLLLREREGTHHRLCLAWRIVVLSPKVECFAVIECGCAVQSKTASWNCRVLKIWVCWPSSAHQNFVKYTSIIFQYLAQEPKTLITSL